MPSSGRLCFSCISLSFLPWSYEEASFRDGDLDVRFALSTQEISQSGELCLVRWACPLSAQTEWKMVLAFVFFRKPWILIPCSPEQRPPYTTSHVLSSSAIAKPFPHRCRPSASSQLGQLTVSFQGRCRSHLCCRLVAADPFQGAFPRGGSRGLIHTSCPFPACLTTPIAAVLYISYS